MVFATTFAEGLGDVEGYLGGLGDAVVLHTRYARMGAYCVKLTAASEGGGTATLGTYLPFPVFSRLGLEITFGCWTTTDYIELHAALREAATHWYPTLRWDPNAGTILVQTGALAWHTVTATQGAFVTPNCCNTVKLVFDIAIGEYVRVIANDQPYSVVGVPIYSVAVGGVPIFFTTVAHQGDAGQSPDAYIDNWIVTQNEP
ncbi:hypothetical protein ES703_66972 [subsurface metagenome]